MGASPEVAEINQTSRHVFTQVRAFMTRHTVFGEAAANVEAAQPATIDRLYTDIQTKVTAVEPEAGAVSWLSPGYSSGNQEATASCTLKYNNSEIRPTPWGVRVGEVTLGLSIAAKDVTWRGFYNMYRQGSGLVAVSGEVRYGRNRPMEALHGRTPVPDKTILALSTLVGKLKP